MNTHLGRNWKRRWKVDVTARTATHENGFVVRFRQNGGNWQREAANHVDGLNAMDAAVLLRQAQQVFEEVFTASARP